MESHTIPFDNEELFHLALKAMESNQVEQAMLYLKQLLQQEPDHGRAHYLLGALHAEIGMYQRAIEEMQRAVELAPELTTAHFQLGLLYATNGMATEAETTWSALDHLSEDDPLLIFKHGLTHLIHDEFEACTEALQKGITLNQANPALNKDMERIMHKITQLPNTDADEKAISPVKNDSEKHGRHILLDAYQSNAYEGDKES